MGVSEGWVRVPEGRRSGLRQCTYSGGRNPCRRMERSGHTSTLSLAGPKKVKTPPHLHWTCSLAEHKVKGDIICPGG